MHSRQDTAEPDCIRGVCEKPHENSEIEQSAIDAESNFQHYWRKGPRTPREATAAVSHPTIPLTLALHTSAILC